MALNGINIALAFTGQEYIWQKLLLSLGLNQDEVDQYFTGPPFLAWNRMGNIERLFGPLPKSFIDGQLILAKKINKRMKELGIKRISPGFSGHLPVSFKRIAPNATLIRLPNWITFNDSFSGTYLLDPKDPLFITIGSKFIQMYNEEFGTDNYYNVDMFNEMTPPTHDLTYIANSGKAVFDSLIKGDPNANWIMQGWLFHNEQYFWQLPEAKALVTSVPLGKLIILDLFSEAHQQYDRLEGYFGAPFIWCMLNNFGGTSGMFGNLHLVNQGVTSARSKYSNMIGIGVTPEGIETNDIMYDFMLESPLRKTPVNNITQWIVDYVTRRYGLYDEKVTSAWLIYGSTLFNETTGLANHGRYELTSRPSLNLTPVIWYDVDLIEIATGLMYSSSGKPILKSSQTFKYDYVNSVREWLVILFSLNYKDFVNSFKERNIELMTESSNKMLGILKDLDKLLKAHPNFRLENWITAASSWATNEKELRSYIEQAKNQVTLWGHNGEIVDYAAKHWSGLVCNYYQPRWELFFKSIFDCVKSNCSSFDESEFKKLVYHQVELPFTTELKGEGSFNSHGRTINSILPFSLLLGEERTSSDIEDIIAVANATFEGSYLKY